MNEKPLSSSAPRFAFLLASAVGCASSADRGAKTRPPPSVSIEAPSPAPPSPPAPPAAPRGWEGLYAFSECAEGEPGSSQCWSYEVSVARDGGAEVAVDGFQTAVRLEARTEPRGDELKVRLEAIDPDNFPPPDAERGDELLALARTRDGVVLRFGKLASPLGTTELLRETSR